MAYPDHTVGAISRPYLAQPMTQSVFKSQPTPHIVMSRRLIISSNETGT